MRQPSKKIIPICVLVLVLGLLAVVCMPTLQKKQAFKNLSHQTENFAATSAERVGKAVITLPDGNTLVGLVNGSADYTPESGTVQGSVRLVSSQLLTHFVAGKFAATNPRLDVFVPMLVTADAYGGSMYVTLLWDRGDAAIERSYARLGGADVVIDELSIMPPQLVPEEYRLSIRYRLKETTEANSMPQEVLIPVIDGHFDPEHTKSR